MKNNSFKIWSSKCLLQKHPKPMWRWAKSFFYYQGYCWSLNLLCSNISCFKFHLVWSAEMSKSQIITFSSLAYYIRDFLLKDVECGRVTTVWWHMFLVIFKFQISWGKKKCKKKGFALFWNVSISGGINEHVHILSQ